MSRFLDYAVQPFDLDQTSHPLFVLEIWGHGTVEAIKSQFPKAQILSDVCTHGTPIFQIVKAIP